MTVSPQLSAARVPLFCNTELGARIERAEADLIARCNEAARRRAGAGGFVTPLAGGVASYAGKGSPYNKVAGLGFGGVPDPKRPSAASRRPSPATAPPPRSSSPTWPTPRSAPCCPPGATSSNRSRTSSAAPSPADIERVTPPGIEVRRSGEDEFAAWLDVVAEGSVHPDTQGVPWHEEFPREVIIEAELDSAEAGDVRYAALRDGVLAGGATMRLADGIAQLTGAATAPAHRRRGIQTALLAARLADAAAAGCDVAVIIVQPGSKSQQNAQRQGFDLLYTRAVLVRQP